MSGLLQRLGARATGTAWAVHSDARLPFGAARLADRQVPPDADPAPQAGTARLPRAHAVDPVVAPPVATRTPAHHAQDIAPTRADPQAVPQAPAPPAARVPLVPDGLLSPQHVPAPAQPPRAADAPAPAPTALRPVTTAMAAPERAPGFAAMPAPVLAAPSTQPTAAALAAPGTPAPLLPARPRNDAQPHHARTAPNHLFGPQRASPTAPQETEVHIHIGRIDVTALHEAPRPKARPRERAQPMSLDAYLAQRGSAK